MRGKRPVMYRDQRGGSEQRKRSKGDVHTGRAERETNLLKVHKIEIFFGFDFEICTISLLVLLKY